MNSIKTLHFDCFAGICGDMVLGALIDLGVDPGDLVRELDKLGLPGWKLKVSRDERNGITGTRALVELDGSTDHLAHDDASVHQHHHDNNDHNKHHHAHNSWKDIRALIEKSGIREEAKRRALAIFTKIAWAEAQVHGVPVDDVAFHEVGALDSIIDIVGAGVCLDMLNPEKITCGEIELGGGTVKCAHGVLPVPAPATALLVRGMPVKTGGYDKEMTTPTGAAILAASVDQFVTGPASFTALKTGAGIGGRRFPDKPNVLQVSWRKIFDDDNSSNSDTDKNWLSEKLLLLEANIDDMTGEAMGFLSERLFGAGALDVTFVPCTMKKSRPGVVASVLFRPDTADAVRETMFRHSTTLGFRESAVNRLFLRREEKNISGDFGAAREKIAFLNGERRSSKIDYDDRARVARERSITLNEAEHLIREAGDENA